MVSSRRTWSLHFLAFAILLFVSGCGGGGKGPTAVATRTGNLARFDVDVATGKVKVTNIEDPRNPSRAVFTGGAASFTTSDLYSEGGDSGQRQLRIDLLNTSGQTLNGNVRLVVSGILNNGDVDLSASTSVSTLAGSGSAGSTDGYGTAASFNKPVSISPIGAGQTGVYVLEEGSHAVRAVQLDGTVRAFAGQAGVPGFADGVGSAAQFNTPKQIATDAAGIAYVADAGNNRIRRITPDGLVNTIAGTGETGDFNGNAGAATFNQPSGIAVSIDGNRIYVADTGNHRIRLVQYNGSGARERAGNYTVTYLYGGGVPGFTDGPPLGSTFSSPGQLGITRNFPDTIYVVDTGNHAIRRCLNSVTTVAGDGTAGNLDGSGAAARLNNPLGISVIGITTANALVVTDRHSARLIFAAGSADPNSPAGFTVRRIAGDVTTGSGDGAGSIARFNTPAGLWTSPNSTVSASTIYCADSSNHKVRKLTVPSPLHSGGPGTPLLEPVRLVNWDSEIPNQNAWAKSFSNGQFPSNNLNANLQFYVPAGVSGFSFTAYVEGDGALINLPGAGASYLTTLAGNGVAGTTDGPGKMAQFMSPYMAAAVPPSLQNSWPSLGPVRALIADADSQRIRALTVSGEMKNFAGSGAYGYADGPGSIAQFRRPSGVAIGADGAVFISDSEGHYIRRVATNGVVSTIAGTGVANSVDGSGAVATVNSPEGIAVDGGGSIYFADRLAHIVRRLEYTGGDPSAASSYYVRTVAGLNNTVGSAEGSGSAARFKNPTGIVCDLDGRIYVADASNHTVRVLTRAGNVCSTATLAGSAGAAGSADGIGSAARFSSPTGVAVDTAHNVYVVEFGGSRVRRVSPLGESKTLMGVAGTGLTDGANGTLNGPRGVSVEANGNLLIADYGNKSIRALQRLLTNAH